MARKEKKAGPPTMTLVFVMMGCFFVVVAGAGFIWNKSQIHTLAEQKGGYELRLEAAKRHRLTLERTYAAMCSQFELDRRVKTMRLELGPPQPDQLVRLYETPGPVQEEKLFAGKTTRTEEGRN